MILPLLLAVFRNDLAGGGGGGPFTISGVNVTQNQPGVDCDDPLLVNVSLVFTGSPSGKTVKIERRFGGPSAAFEVVDTGVAPTGFPRQVAAPGYYNKFGVGRGLTVRVTDETDADNLATSAVFTTTYSLCEA